MTIGGLAGLNVLVTRPQAQSENLAAYIVEQGGNPLIFPTLGIESVVPAAGWETVMTALQTTDIVVFISANAVREVMPHWQNIRQGLSVAAIGRATAAELAEHNVIADAIPMSDYRSEGLLALPAFANLKGKKVTIFAGVGGREYLETVLTERGAHTEKIAVYQRYQPQTDPDILLLFLERTGPKIIIATSVESLENLIVMAKPVGEINDINLLVISERMRDFAIKAEFTHVVVAHQASSDSLVADLKSWYSLLS